MNYQITCDRCRCVSISDAGAGYIAFRRTAGKAGWIRRHNKWFGPCCMSVQLSLDLARTQAAREVSPGRPRQ